MIGFRYFTTVFDNIFSTKKKKGTPFITSIMTLCNTESSLSV